MILAHPGSEDNNTELVELRHLSGYCPLAFPLSRRCVGWGHSMEDCPLGTQATTSHLCTRSRHYDTTHVRHEKRRLSLNLVLQSIEYIYAGGEIKRIPLGATSETWEVAANPAPLSISIQLQKRLPASTLSEYTPSQTLQSKLHRLPKSTTIRDLSDFLASHTPRSLLVSLFGTTKDRNGLRSALGDVDFAASRYRPRPLTSSRAANLILSDDRPDSAIESAYNQVLTSCRFAGISGDWRSDWRHWLPWTSIEITIVLRRLKSTPINALRRAIFKLAAQCDDGDNLYPWTRGFNPETARLPVLLVASFSSSERVRDALRDLRKAGAISVDDLRCLHPSAVEHAQHPGKPLFHLFHKLRS